MIQPILSRSGVSAPRLATQKRLFLDTRVDYVPGGIVVDSSARDRLNTVNPKMLRPGVPLVKHRTNDKYNTVLHFCNFDSSTATHTVQFSNDEYNSFKNLVGASGVCALLIEKMSDLIIEVNVSSPNDTAKTYNVTLPASQQKYTKNGKLPISGLNIGGYPSASAIIMPLPASYNPVDCLLVPDSQGILVGDTDVDGILAYRGMVITKSLVAPDTHKAMLKAWLKLGNNLYTFDDDVK